MKKCLFILFLCQSIFLYSQEFSLELENAYTSGEMIKGDSIFVWSEIVESDGIYALFSHWSGTGAKYLSTQDEWRSVLKIPVNETENSFTLKANYGFNNTAFSGEYTINQFGEENENGDFFAVDKSIHYAFPLEPKAIVFLIHGTGGHSESWFKNFEKKSIVDDLVANNYAVFALNSNETTLGDQDGDGKVRWENSFFKQDTLTNIDFKNVNHTKNYIDKNLDFGHIPVFIVGGSNGANFGDYCTAALDYEASAHMTGNGNTTIFDFYENLKPIIWIQSRNDNNPSANDSIAWANYQKLLNKNIKTEWHWLEKSPAYPQRFKRSFNNINEYLSASFYDSLLVYNIIDENGFLTIDNIKEDLPENFYNFNFLNTSQTNDIIYQLNVINADHIANGDFNKSIIRFFDNCIANSTNIKNLNIDLNTYKIFPNPINEFVHIESQTNVPFSYQVINNLGQIIFESTAKTPLISIDFTMYTSGIYFLRINENETFETYKIIKR